MKKMLLATALATYYRMCSTDVYCSKQTGSSSTKGNHHPSFLRFWNWAEENCRCSQNLWRLCWKILLKQNPTNIRIDSSSFMPDIVLLEPVLASLMMHELPIDMTALSLLINILLGSFSCFCIVISLSLRVK